MKQYDFFNVSSPCIAVCQLNNNGYCKGCFRSREERLHWQEYTNQQKSNVIRLASLRYWRVMRGLRENEEKQKEQTPKNVHPDLFEDEN